MRIELVKALLPEDLEETECGLCVQRFRPLGAVLVWVRGAQGQHLGYACPLCTLYFGQRNPERFPSPEEYLTSTQQYPEPVFASPEEWEKAEDEGTFEAEYLSSWLS